MKNLDDASNEMALRPNPVRAPLYALLFWFFLALMLIALWAGIANWPKAFLPVPFCLFAAIVGLEGAIITTRLTFRENRLQMNPSGLTVIHGGIEHRFLWNEIERVGFIGGGFSPQSAALYLKRETPGSTAPCACPPPWPAVWSSAFGISVIS